MHLLSPECRIGFPPQVLSYNRKMSSECQEVLEGIEKVAFLHTLLLAIKNLDSRKKLYISTYELTITLSAFT